MSTNTSAALHDLTVSALARQLQQRQVSAVEVAQHFLDRAQAHQALGAYVAIDAPATLAQAQAADARLAAGTWDFERFLETGKARFEARYLGFDSLGRT